MKRALAFFLSFTLLAVAVLATGAFSVSADATDTWVEFEEKQLPVYDERGAWSMDTNLNKTTTFANWGYVDPDRANIIKYVASESGTLSFSSQWTDGCKNTNTTATSQLQFVLLDKNKKVIFPTDGSFITVGAGEYMDIDLVTEVAAGDAFYFFHRNTGSVYTNSFSTNVVVSLNGATVSNGGQICTPGGIAEQGKGGWYYMYADTASISVTHNDPNSATDLGRGKYVASYTPQLMQNSGSLWYGTNINNAAVGGSIAYPQKGESVICRFTAPADGTFRTDYCAVLLYPGSEQYPQWTVPGTGVDFFIANQNGEVVEPANGGVHELRSAGAVRDTNSTTVPTYLYVYNMKKGDYLDFVFVSAPENTTRYGVQLQGGIYFNKGDGDYRIDSGSFFLGVNEQQGDRDIQLFYATDVQLEETADEWAEYIQLSKPLTAAPATVEAWVNISADVADYKVGTLMSDYKNGVTDGFTVSMDTFGRPRVQYGNGTLDWTVDTVDLRTGTWQHVAFTVDAANDTVAFYLNGELSANATIAGITAAASDRAPVIGNDLAYGVSTAFSGQMKKLAVWSDVRTAAEVRADMADVQISADGLIGYYPLNGSYNDKSAAANHGKVTTVNTPYYAGTPADAEEGEYTIVHMGDQQVIAQYYPDVLPSITQWIVDNQKRLNIQAVVNTGDYVNNATFPSEWVETVAATKLLTDKNIPFFFASGNHEHPNNGLTVRDDSYIKAHFPLASYFNQATGLDNEAQVLYAYPSTNELTGIEDLTDDMSIENAVYHTVLGGQEYLIVTLEIQPRYDVINNWANVIMPQLESKYPNAKTIVCTHDYMMADGTLNPYKDTFPHDNDKLIANNGQELYENFIIKHESITLVLCGHMGSGVATRTDIGKNGNKITTILNDASYEDNGGEGTIMLLRFKKDGTVQAEYYSTLREAYYMPEYQFEFTLEDEEADQYWLDLDVEEMDFKREDGALWYADPANTTGPGHTKSNAWVSNNGRAAVRTFVAPWDGTFFAENIWSTRGLSLFQPNGATDGNGSVKFAVTDDNGKVLWPTDGKPMTLREGDQVGIAVSTPVKQGDKIHFVVYGATAALRLEYHLIAYMDYPGSADNQFVTSGYPCSAEFEQGPRWYYNYANSVSELTYNPANPSEGVKSNVNVTYKVEGIGGGLQVNHNGNAIANGKIDMPKGGSLVAKAYPKDGYRIKGYYVNGVNMGRDFCCTLVQISEDIELVVEFEKIPVVGDANDDGVVNVLDLVNLAGEESAIVNKAVCDLVDPNHENILDADDFRTLRRMILK